MACKITAEWPRLGRGQLLLRFTNGLTVCREGIWSGVVSRILFCLLLIQGGFIAAAKKDLARLAILNFADETGTKNYGYLPGSLTEAIDKSLQHKFEYMREDPAKSEAAVKNFAGSGGMDPERAGIFARSNNIDIVVSGSFTLDRTTKEVVVTTYVAFGNSAKFRRLKERKNPADATIFSLAAIISMHCTEQPLSVTRFIRGTGGASLPTQAWAPRLAAIKRMKMTEKRTGAFHT